MDVSHPIHISQLFRCLEEHIVVEYFMWLSVSASCPITTSRHGQFHKANIKLLVPPRLQHRWISIARKNANPVPAEPSQTAVGRRMSLTWCS
jgi:hypothetical protein